MNIVLETSAVLKTYRTAGQTINAVDHVDIAVQAGEFVALVGPTASGKTFIAYYVMEMCLRSTKLN